MTDFFAHLRKNPSLDKDGIAQLKLVLCKKHNVKRVPTDIELLMNAPDYAVATLRKQLQTKPGRSLSGVTPVAIMTSPALCPHGKCTTCPGGLDSPWGDVPQSYTGAEPATMRAMRANYDAYVQVFNRLEQYMVTGHSPDKVDLIVMGGTFPARDASYQDEFIMYAFKAMNDFSELFFSTEGDFLLDEFKTFFLLPGELGSEERTTRIHERLQELKKSSSLLVEQERNQTAHIRCIGLTIETRPDFAKLVHANKMLEQGCTRVELGVQSVYDEALLRINRGHTTKDNQEAIAILRDLGFKLNFHLMLGLPGVSADADVAMFEELFTNDAYRPDMLKIYPCMVLSGTKLEKDFLSGLFVPLSTQQAADIIVRAIPFVPTYCRIMRVQRDIPTYKTLGGVSRTNLRQYVQELMHERQVTSRDIRAREVGRKQVTDSSQLDLTTLSFTASGGQEFFIAVEDVTQDVLFGFCRLRFPAKQLREEFTPTTAIIRELHVYGSAVGIGDSDVSSSQHKGFGKQLVAKAEEICKASGFDRLLVISGVGVREYYKKLGFVKEGPYMAKQL